MSGSRLLEAAASLITMVALCTAVPAAGADAQPAADQPAASSDSPPPKRTPPPEDVARCAVAVERAARGHAKFDAFTWDREDPRKYIHSTLMLSTEFRGKLVPVDYTLILVGELRQRGTGKKVEGNGICGMRGGQIISARVARSTARD